MNQELIEKVLQSVENIEQGLVKFKRAFYEGEYSEIKQIHQKLRNLIVANFDSIGLSIQDNLQIENLKRQIQSLKKIQPPKSEIKNPPFQANTFQDGSLSLEQSDMYETLPSKFTNVIPKTHYNLNKLIDFYHNNIENKGKPKYGQTMDRYWQGLFSQEGIKCKYCFQKSCRQQKLNEHIKCFHTEWNTQKCPYRQIFQNLNCMIGCQFKADSKSQLRMHLIIYHRTQELQLWGISRQYLKYQEKLITFDEITKEEKTQKPNLSTYRDVKTDC